MREERLTEKERLLYELCCRSCMIDMSGYDYISTTGSLAWQLGISKYKVRKYLKEYEREGLVERVCEGGFGDDELRVWCIKGWVITPKVRYMDIYKWANWHESKIMWEIWQIVPSEYYATNTARWHEWEKSLHEDFRSRRGIKKNYSISV